VLCPKAVPANPAQRRTARTVVDHLSFIMLPPKVVAADPNLLRLFRFKPAKVLKPKLFGPSKSLKFLSRQTLIFFYIKTCATI
jgi:hypothetical protein